MNESQAAQHVYAVSELSQQVKSLLEDEALVEIETTAVVED